MRYLGVVVLLLVGAGSASSAAPPGTPWIPKESWPGGTQADARLDQAVRLWGAGIPLAKVFTEIRQQTGVSIGFEPADDANARVCVDLFLNAKQPPTLRELMALTAGSREQEVASRDGQRHSVGPPE